MKWLKDLVAHEVSLVKRGANKKPFLVLKSDQGEAMTEKRPSDQFRLTPEQAAEEDAFLQRCIGRVAKAEDGVAPLSDRAQAALKAVYRILLPYKDEITDADIDELASTVGIGSSVDDEEDDDDGNDVIIDDEAVNQSADPNPDSEETMDDKKDKKDKPPFLKADSVSDDDHGKAMTAAKAAYKKALEETCKSDEDEEEEMDKSANVSKSAAGGFDLSSLPPEVRAHVQAVTKSASDKERALIEKSAALEARVRKMEDDREMSGYEEIINGELKALSMDAKETSKVMKSLAAVGDGALDQYLTNLRALNEQVRTGSSFNSAGGLYGAQGVNPSQADRARNVTKSRSSGTAAEEIDQLVNNHLQNNVAKSDGTATTYADAWAAVMATPHGVDLYERSMRERNV